MIQKVSLFQNPNYFSAVKMPVKKAPVFTGDLDSGDKVELSTHSQTDKEPVNDNKNMDMAIEATPLSGKKKLTGSIGGKPYSIEVTRKKITGTFDNKPIDITITTPNLFGSKDLLVGEIGGKPIKLETDDSLNKHSVSGKYNGKELNASIKLGMVNDEITGDYDDKNINVNVKTKGIVLKTGRDIDGNFNAPAELFPILMGCYVNSQEKANLAIAGIAAGV